MRQAVLAAFLVACSSGQAAPAVQRDAPREATLQVTYLDTIDGAPATHLAVGGRMRITVPGAPASWADVSGPFTLVATSFDTFVITAQGAGSGEVEIETAAGLARFHVSAAPLAKVEVRDVSSNEAAIALLDADGKRLVDANLRLAGGGAPVTFAGAWDRIELGSLAEGTHEIFVKTTTTAPSRVTVVKHAATEGCWLSALR
jgi:hypothetical protein